jgi:hypothetical protein
MVRLALMSTWIADDKQIFKCRPYFFKFKLSSLNFVHAKNCMKSEFEISVKF